MRFTGIVETLIVTSVTPIDGEYVDVRFSFMTKKVGNETVTANVGKAFIAEIERQLGQDIPIWGFKVLSDPLHNIALYWKSPLALLRGELIDPTIKDASHWGAAADESESEEAAHLT